MIATIYSIGYSVREDQQRLVEIMNADPRTIIIDTRKEPSSKVPGYDEKHRHELSQRWGKRYQWLGMTLGNVNYKPEDRSKGIQLVDEKAGIRTLINGLKYDHSLILLCGCQDACTCHRTYIARKLITALLKSDIPFDVSRNVVLGLLGKATNEKFLDLAKKEQEALTNNDLLEAEGYRLQALETLVV